MYKTFTEWKNGNWLEDGEPRKEAYTKDELLLVEMGWKYGFDAGKAQQADQIAELEKELKHYKMAWNMAENELENQTKPLSDEEIEEIAKQHLAAYAQFIGAGEVCYEGEIDFARAIEERHGIK